MMDFFLFSYLLDSHFFRLAMTDMIKRLQMSGRSYVRLSVHISCPLYAVTKFVLPAFESRDIRCQLTKWETFKTISSQPQGRSQRGQGAMPPNHRLSAFLRKNCLCWDVGD